MSIRYCHHGIQITGNSSNGQTGSFWCISLRLSLRRSRFWGGREFLGVRLLIGWTCPQLSEAFELLHVGEDDSPIAARSQLGQETLAAAVHPRLEDSDHDLSDTSHELLGRWPCRTAHFNFAPRFHNPLQRINGNHRVHHAG